MTMRIKAHECEKTKIWMTQVSYLVASDADPTPWLLDTLDEWHKYTIRGEIFEGPELIPLHVIGDLAAEGTIDIIPIDTTERFAKLKTDFELIAKMNDELQCAYDDANERYQDTADQLVAAKDQLKIATELLADANDMNETLRLRVDELESESVAEEIEENGCELTAAKVTLRPLRYYRKAAMLKQSEMGELLGVSGSVISRLESGQWNALKKERFLEIAGLFKELQGLKS